MKRTILAVISVFLLEGAAAAQDDVVRLRSGKVLVGTILPDGELQQGVTIRLWDTDGIVFVRWSQVPDAEAVRLRNRLTGPGEAAPADLIDAVRFVTANRDFFGLIVSETSDRLEIKTREGVQTLPAGAVLQRTPVRVRESEVYSTDEMIAKRLKDVADSDAPKLVEVGKFAVSLKAYASARKLYEKALAAAQEEGLRQEIRNLMEGVELLVKEEAAENALAGVWKLADELKFEEALAAADKFLADHGQSGAARANPDLREVLEKRQAEFKADRDKVLAEKVPEQWRAAIAGLIHEYGSLRQPLREIRELVHKMDEEIVGRVAKKIDCEPDEAGRFWDARPKDRVRAVSFKDGTWIYLGGQDGGLDYEGTGEEDKKEDPYDEYRRRFDDGRRQEKKPAQPLGQKLRTSQEWWDRASLSLRREWLEAYYAMTSGRVKRETEEKNCSRCQGRGKLPVVRSGKQIEIICPTCHETKKIITVKYW